MWSELLQPASVAPGSHGILVIVVSHTEFVCFALAVTIVVGFAFGHRTTSITGNIHRGRGGRHPGHYAESGVACNAREAMDWRLLLLLGSPAREKVAGNAEVQ